MEGVNKFGNSVSQSKLGDLSFVSPTLANRTVGDVDGWTTGTEKKSSLSSISWVKANDSVIVNGNYFQQSTLLNGIPSSPLQFSGFQNTGAFSSSLPALFHEKLNLSSSVGQHVDIGASHVDEESGDQDLGSLEELESQTIGNLLPDDEDELLAGITDGVLSNVEEPEDFDLFSSGGGLEMDSDTSQERFGVFMNYHRGLDSFPGGVSTHQGSVNGAVSVIGEHPYGEHPSRTLFVRNINSNVEDSELRALFEQYGAIRTLYAQCKHRGFVMISYYDIRAARTAMRALQNKPLRRRKLDIHFSIPKDNPSDKDINQGTLVVFNLDASVSNDDLRQIFGAYGEVKEIRETPHKRHHKFIEFYDVRAAEAALRALNRSDIAGKRIKLEPSRPGGARRSLMQQLSQELEQEETWVYRQQASSPLTNSPSGHSPIWGQIGSPVQNGCPRGIQPSVGLGMGTVVPGASETLARPSPGLPFPHHTVGRVGTIGSHFECNNSVAGSHSPIPANRAINSMTSYHAHSFPDHSSNAMPFHMLSTSVSVQDGSSLLHGPYEGIEELNVRRTNGPGSDTSLFEHVSGAGLQSTGSRAHLSSVPGEMGSLSGPQFLWGNSSNHQRTVPNSSSIIWPTSATSHAFNPARRGELQPYGFSGTHGCFVNTMLPSHPHHAGSAPPGDPSILERHLGYFGDSPNPPFLGPGSLGPMGCNGNCVVNMGGGAHGIMAFGSNEGHGSSLPSITGVMSPRPGTQMYQAGRFPVSFSGSDVLIERGRFRRTESYTAQADKKQYQLDIDRILRGEDTRTTLMIKNIPNKYTSKMLLAAIDESHRGTYDFLYLPIDFKNKCNVGYAFINMTAPQHIIPFYEAFNGKKWEKFNSEKVASLAYARIQGKAALVTHFQNSSLMNEDKRCRPILFHSNGPEAGDQEPFPLGVNIRPRVNHEQNVNADNRESGAGNNRDEFISGSMGSIFGAIVSSSPEKD